MITVTKSFTFSAAHMLQGHEGLCRNLHGHNYLLEVEVTGPILDSGSSKAMVIDFSQLKSIVNDKVVNLFDHSFIADQFMVPGLEHDLVSLLSRSGSKVVMMPGRPTAENMVNLIAEMLGNYLNVTRIRLYETPTSYAEVIL